MAACSISIVVNPGLVVFLYIIVLVEIISWPCGILELLK